MLIAVNIRANVRVRVVRVVWSGIRVKVSYMVSDSVRNTLGTQLCFYRMTPQVYSNLRCALQYAPTPGFILYIARVITRVRQQLSCHDDDDDVGQLFVAPLLRISLSACTPR